MLAPFGNGTACSTRPTMVACSRAYQVNGAGRWEVVLLLWHRDEVSYGVLVRENDAVGWPFACVVVDLLPT